LYFFYIYLFTYYTLLLSIPFTSLFVSHSALKTPLMIQNKALAKSYHDQPPTTTINQTIFHQEFTIPPFNHQHPHKDLTNRKSLSHSAILKTTPRKHYTKSAHPTIFAKRSAHTSPKPTATGIEQWPKQPLRNTNPRKSPPISLLKSTICLLQYPKPKANMKTNQLKMKMKLTMGKRNLVPWP